MSNEAQFGIVKTLRPFVGFETLYQGSVAGTTPIMFTEGGVALDSQAGTAGFSPNLLRGLSTPMGSNVVLWLPYFFGLPAAGGVAAWFYNWRLIWRFRSTADYRLSRIAYHYATSNAGVPNTSGGPTARVVIPAAVNPIVYTQTQPVTPNLGNPTSVDRIDVITPSVDGAIGSPFVPGGGTGEYQQGILDPNTAGTLATRPIYIPYSVTALGDELLVAVDRNAPPNSGTHADLPNWGFAAGEVDNVFSDLFGNGQGKAFPDIGVYVSSGAAS